MCCAKVREIEWDRGRGRQVGGFREGFRGKGRSRVKGEGEVKRKRKRREINR